MDYLHAFPAWINTYRKNIHTFIAGLMVKLIVKILSYRKGTIFRRKKVFYANFRGDLPYGFFFWETHL